MSAGLSAGPDVPVGGTPQPDEHDEEESPPTCRRREVGAGTCRGGVDRVVGSWRCASDFPWMLAVAARDVGHPSSLGRWSRPSERRSIASWRLERVVEADDGRRLADQRAGPRSSPVKTSSDNATTSTNAISQPIPVVCRACGNGGGRPEGAMYDGFVSSNSRLRRIPRPKRLLRPPCRPPCRGSRPCKAKYPPRALRRQDPAVMPAVMTDGHVPDCRRSGLRALTSSRNCVSSPWEVVERPPQLSPAGHMGDHGCGRRDRRGRRVEQPRNCPQHRAVGVTGRQEPEPSLECRVRQRAFSTGSLSSERATTRSPNDENRTAHDQHPGLPRPR